MDDENEWNDINPYDDYDRDLQWPVDGCWEAFELGMKHGREDLSWNERPPEWFNADEEDDYHEGYIEGRRRG